MGRACGRVRARARPNGCRMTGCGGVGQRLSTLRPLSLFLLCLIRSFLVVMQGRWDTTKQGHDSSPSPRESETERHFLHVSMLSIGIKMHHHARALATTAPRRMRHLPEHVAGIVSCQEARAAYARNDGSKTLLCPYPGSLLSVFLATAPWHSLSHPACPALTLPAVHWHTLCNIGSENLDTLPCRPTRKRTTRAEPS